MPLADFRVALAERDKRPLCQLCELRPGMTVDHNHKTGKFRGILCRVCNTNLGWLKNHWISAREYLKGDTEISIPW